MPSTVHNRCTVSKKYHQMTTGTSSGQVRDNYISTKNDSLNRMTVTVGAYETLAINYERAFPTLA